MISVIVLSIACLAFLLFLSPRSSGLKRNGKALPRPPHSLPIIGNGILFLQDRHKLFSWFTKCTQKFGLETFEISVPSLPPGIVINDPRNLEFVFKNEGIFEKGEFFKKRSWDLFGNGIINSDGQAWKVQRKAGLHFMSISNLQVLTDVLLPKYLDGLTTTLNGAAETGELVDLEFLFLELTTQLMGSMAYDMEMHASASFSQAFDYASGKTGERFQNPLWQITEPILDRKFKHSIATVKKFGQEIVSTAVQSRKSQAMVREYMNTTGISGGDVSDFEGDEEGKDVVEGSLIHSLLDSIGDHQMVADAALNYLSAGRDTTAQSLTWTFYLLMRNPETLPSLLKEIGSHKAQKLTTGGLTPQYLPLIMATIYESLRLYPPVPFELKQCVKADGVTFPDGTFLPYRSIVAWCPWAINRSSEIWPSEDASIPSTPEDFRPQRWLKTENSKEGKESVQLISRPAHEFPVFNGGSRTCLGKKMAEAVMCQVVARLVERYEFKMGDGGKERVSRNSLTLPMQGGLEVYVVKRET